MIEEKKAAEGQEVLDTGASKKPRPQFWYKILNIWDQFKQRHPGFSQFLVFLILSCGVTLLQVILMPVFKALLGMTELVNTNFQIWQTGQNFDGSLYYVFDYAKGAIANGGGGGLAYFLAVQITLLVAQIINFFAQRNITFKANGSVWKAAMWYFIAYVIISVSAAALQGVYKAPIYNLLINTWDLGKTGEMLADFITMMAYSTISFLVFFPIFRLIFKSKKQ
jgi:putative flippase GtrA